MDNPIQHISTEDLIIELNRRNLITNSKSNESILKNLNNTNDVQFVLTYGLPKEFMECRECCECLHPENFSYYMSRVDQNGYLMRSNALCDKCGKKNNKQRLNVFKNSKIPKKPNKGAVCLNCDRKWSGNWHRHHEGDKFVNWLCGHCNMSFSDQRNKK
jgi:hypothetical protein